LQLLRSVAELLQLIFETVLQLRGRVLKQLLVVAPSGSDSKRI
jgi:hypothetical protein